MPGRRRAGRTLAYWSKDWQIARRSPTERDVVGHVGRADRAEIDGVERFGALAQPSAGIIAPCCL